MATYSQNVLKIVNPCIGFLFVLQALSGFFHDEIPYDVFSKMHLFSGIVLSCGVVVHLVFNYRWFITAYKKRKQV